MNYMENMPIQPNMIMPFNNQNIINELLYKLNEMDNKIKERYADIIIDTNNTKEKLKVQLIKIIKELEP